MKTKYEAVARGIPGRVEETVRLPELGTMVMPTAVDPGRFIRADGKRNFAGGELASIP
jgi:hypothetical protein